MYRNLAGRTVAILLVMGLWANVFAGPADDQYTIAARHYSDSRWRFAADEFKVFLAEYPDDERAGSVAFFLAETFVQLGQFDEAYGQFEEYLAGNADGKYARQSLFRKGETAYLGGDQEKAVVSLERFRNKYPDDALNSYLLAYLGEISLDQEQPKLAEEFFSEGLKQFPDGAMADECRFGLARSMELLGDKDAAIHFYRFLGQREERGSLSDDAQLQLAILLYEQKRFDESIQALKQFHARFPGDPLAPHAWYWLGTGQMAIGQWAAAAESFTAGTRRFPDHVLSPAMSFSCGESFRHVERNEDARSRYRSVVDRWPDSRWADDSLQSLVQLAWGQSDLTRVESLAEEFLERFSTSPLRWLVWQTQGRAHIKRGDFDKAAAVFESLIRDEAGLQPQPAIDSQEALADREEGVAGQLAPSVSQGDLAAEDVTVSETEAVLATADVTASETEAVIRAKAIPTNRYYLALAYLGLERFQEALDALARVPTIAGPPELVEGILIARASSLIGLDRYAQAIRPLKEYLDLQSEGPDVVKCRVQLAVALARLGRWPETIDVFNRLRMHDASDPLYLPTVQYVAEAAYDQGQRREATELFKELTRDGNPSQYRTRGLSGLAWLQWEGPDGAARSAATFERLLQQYPESPLAAEAAMMRGRSLEKTAKPSAALGMYRLVLEQYPDSKHAKNAMLAAARIHDQLAQDRDAEVLLRRLLAASPDDEQLGPALYQLAWVLVDLKREDEADRLFERIRKELPDSEYWADATYRLAERAARAKQFERADQLADEIVQASDDSRMVCYAIYLRGQLAATQSRWKDVVEFMGTVRKRFPETPLRSPAEYWLGEAHYRLHDYETAGKLFDRLEQQAKGRTDSWIAMIPLRRAQVAAHQGRWSDAFEIAQHIATRFPNFRHQYEVDYLLGRCYARQAKFDSARKAYEAVVRFPTAAKNETAAMAQWMIGETFFLQKKFDEAIRAYYRVEALYPYPRWQAAALLQAGKCQEMKGQWQEAMQLYTQVIRDYSSSAFAQKASIRLRVAQQRAEISEMR